MKEYLTQREKEILILRVAGKTRPHIAKELGVSLSTVKTHLENIHRKLDVDNQIGLYKKALELGLVKVS